MSRIIRRKEVLRLVGLGKTRLHELIREGRFPEPVSLTGGRAVGWWEAEVVEWIRSRPRVSHAACPQEER